MEDLLRSIKGQMEVFKMAADKAVTNGNKEAGLRSRKASREIDKLMKEWRKVSVKEGK